MYCDGGISTFIREIYGGRSCGNHGTLLRGDDNHTQGKSWKTFRDQADAEERR